MNFRIIETLSGKFMGQILHNEHWQTVHTGVVNSREIAHDQCVKHALEVKRFADYEQRVKEGKHVIEEFEL